jgi:DMSO reductase anchor subunit
MHPAFSVIFFTTLIGVGQGLFLALYAGELLTQVGDFAPPDSRSFYALGSAISVLFLGVGLAASFLHLGHPERAWRSAAMWRTSWLSREVIVLPAFMFAVFLYGIAHYFGWNAGPQGGTEGKAVVILGGIAVILCLTLFVCTGMIYACIKFMQEWASPLTLVNYFLLGSASGFTLATAFAFFTAADLVRIYGVTAAILSLAALITRTASLYRNARIKPKSNLQTATGIRHPQIVQKAQGSMGGSFNTREFFHGKSVQFLRSVKWIFLVLAFFVPVVLLGIGLVQASALLLAIAFVIQYMGLIAERWFFFAQANHPQNLYYQAIS